MPVGKMESGRDFHKSRQVPIAEEFVILDKLITETAPVDSNLRTRVKYWFGRGRVGRSGPGNAVKRIVQDAIIGQFGQLEIGSP